MAMFTGMMHMPAPLAFLAIAVEFFGGLGLILGCLTRIAACGIGGEHAGRDGDRP
jgi:putative oxidoreductase